MTGVMARSQMAGISEAAASTRAISSMQMAQVTWSAPEPPQSSGNVRPMSPMAENASWACQGYRAFSSASAAPGATLSSHIWRTAWRKSSCSSVVRNMAGCYASRDRRTSSVSTTAAGPDCAGRRS